MTICTWLRVDEAIVSIAGRSFDDSNLLYKVKVIVFKLRLDRPMSIPVAMAVGTTPFLSMAKVSSTPNIEFFEAHTKSCLLGFSLGLNLSFHTSRTTVARLNCTTMCVHVTKRGYLKP